MSASRAKGLNATQRDKAAGEQRRERLRELRQELLAYYPGPLPRSRLVIMDVDPATLHAYWSIDPDYLAGLRRRHRTPAAPLVLRLQTLNGQDDGSRHLEYDLEGLTNNRYITLWGEGRTFVGQIGLRTKSRFISVATSAPVRLPDMGLPPPPPPQVSAAAEDGQGGQGEEEPTAEEAARVHELQSEREQIIRSRYRELTERAAAGGHEGLEASEPPKEVPTFNRAESIAQSVRLQTAAAAGGPGDTGTAAAGGLARQGLAAGARSIWSSLGWAIWTKERKPWP